MNQRIEHYYPDFNVLSSYGITVNDMNGGYLFANAAFCQIVGYSLKELQSMSFKDITHPEDTGKNITLDNLLKSGQIPFFQMTKRYFRKDKQLVKVLLQVSLLREQPEDVYVAMVMDITDASAEMDASSQFDERFNRVMSSLPEELRYLMTSYEYINRYKLKNQRKSNHLANMVHELRTPLSAIKGSSSRLQRCIEKGELERVGDCISFIESGCETLNHLIHEILDFEMIDSGGYSLQCEPANLIEVVEDTIAKLQPYAEEHQLSLFLEAGSPQYLPVLFDPNKINFVFNNLISNAIKYTEKGSVCVKVSLLNKDGEDFVLVSISDTGIGIAEEDFDALFNEYKKINHSIDKKVDSVGLGLPIAKKIAELHGGFITVSSVLGEGSTFSVGLPRLIVD